jgi:hypothetical protein
LLVTAADVYSVGPGNNTFRIKQNMGLWDDENGVAVAYLYEAGDVFFVRCKGRDLGAYDDNIVAQARDLLLEYSDLVSGDLDANWNTYRDKASPAQSNIAGFKSRIWENEPKPLMSYVLSLLEQVRLEAFVDRNLMVKLNSLHFEDWIASPTYEIKNWDVVEGSLRPKIDDKNLFNRARGDFDFHPNRNQNARLTAIQRNDPAIAQIGKQITKQIVFPNLYEQATVVYQLVEIIRLASSLFETVDCALTWRSLLQDIGGFIMVDVEVASILFDSVPMMIRNIGYDPNGLRIPITLWNFQLVPFPGYTPLYSGTVGGYNAAITEEIP